MYRGSKNLRAHVAELVGTFILVLADCGIAVTSGIGMEELGVAARSAISGLSIMTIIFAFGEISGAHINPAVTISFALRRVFPWRRVPGYIAAQLAGAFLAVGLLLLLYGNVNNLGANAPVGSANSAFILEAFLTAILVCVILATSHQAQVKGPESAFPVGAAVVICGLLGKNIGGGSMNPARSLAPAALSGSWEGCWIYLVAPLAGGMIAVLMMWLLYGPPEQEEIKAAKGR